MSNQIARGQILAKLHRADGRFVSVVFPKVDGSLRTMVIKRASLEQFVNPHASLAASLGALKRDINHPNLIRVFEAVNGGQPRTVDLDKVQTITCNGITEHVIRHDYGVRFVPVIA